VFRLRASAAAAAIGLIAVALTSARPADTAAPPNFTDTLVAAVAAPTALAFTPDGRMLIATQPGTLRVLSGGTVLPTAAIDLSGAVCNGEEQGLLGAGVAADPELCVRTATLGDPLSG